MDNATQKRIAQMKREAKALRGNWWRLNEETIGDTVAGVVVAMYSQPSRLKDKDESHIIEIDAGGDEPVKIDAPGFLLTRFKTLGINEGDLVMITYRGKEPNQDDAKMSHHTFWVDNEESLAKKTAEKEAQKATAAAG